MRIGILGLTFLLLLTLKLLGLINISWLWVFAPLIISGVVAIIVLILLGIGIILAAILK